MINMQAHKGLRINVDSEAVDCLKLYQRKVCLSDWLECFAFLECQKHKMCVAPKTIFRCKFRIVYNNFHTEFSCLLWI